MRTFFITTLGCKVNHYETEQIAAFLTARGLRQVHRAEEADLQVVNTCSVTTGAASKSRQIVRHIGRSQASGPQFFAGGLGATSPGARRRIIVTGCWATSDRDEASSLPGVAAVITHYDQTADRLDRLLSLWLSEDQLPPVQPTLAVRTKAAIGEAGPESLEDDGWMNQASTPPVCRSINSKSSLRASVKENPAAKALDPLPRNVAGGVQPLPELGQRQKTRQRAFLKIQDGCDAHCTYCLIPRLRSRLWSKPMSDVVAEARRLVEAGHLELVLTGIFLGAYGQNTAVHRRQALGRPNPLAELVGSLCHTVRGLRRLRLSSLEPGDLTDELLEALGSNPQVVPHFHIPLQSGSNVVLHRMNRQYRREEYLSMIARLRQAFDRPALTTDIIVGFPGETEAEFEQTVDVVNRAGFIHIHAFPFSPRPRTAAARWTNDFVRGPVVNQRLQKLRQLALQHSLAFRRQFVGETVQILVERDSAPAALQHGRCERHFTVHFPGQYQPGESLVVRIDRVSSELTLGTPLGNAKTETRKLS